MIFFYLLIILIIGILLMPHNNQESFIVSTFKEKVLAKTDDLSKYMILHN
jgi:hypothetical protein